jgi:uncharacterized membrane protein HdeD (DUF308 family)
MSDDEGVKVEVIDEGGNGSGSARGKKKRKVAWGLLVGGILLVALGLACIVWPGQSLNVIGMLVGIGFLISGAISIAEFFATGGLALFTGWILLDGIICALLGVLFMMEPMFSGAAMAWLLAIFVIAAGCMLIASAMRIHAMFEKSSWWALLILGILTVIVGILFFPFPQTMSLFLGLFAIVYGVLLCVLAFDVPKIFG